MRVVQIACVCVLLLFCAAATAGPITGDIYISGTKIGSYTLVDDILPSNLTISAGPVALTGTTPLNLGSNRVYMLNFSLTDSPDPDGLSTGGTVQHITSPPDAHSRLTAETFIFRNRGRPHC
jgi:hypothetical protein